MKTTIVPIGRTMRSFTRNHPLWFIKPLESSMHHLRHRRSFIGNGLSIGMCRPTATSRQSQPITSSQNTKRPRINMGIAWPVKPLEPSQAVSSAIKSDVEAVELYPQRLVLF